MVRARSGRGCFLLEVVGGLGAGSGYLESQLHVAVFVCFIMSCGKNNVSLYMVVVSNIHHGSFAPILLLSRITSEITFSFSFGRRAR